MSSNVAASAVGLPDDLGGVGSRPAKVVLVVGTGTEVGKTWVGAGLLRAWRRNGLTVAARKPVQSFDLSEGMTDADALAEASGEEPTQVCPSSRWYPLPMAPPMAADALGLALIRLSDLIAEIRWPSTQVDVGLVETAGGVCSPVAHDGDSLGFGALLRPDQVVLVADAGLGTINAVTLSMTALKENLGERSNVESWAQAKNSYALAEDRFHVVLNRFDARDGLHQRNREWLIDRSGLRVHVVGVDELLPQLASSI